MTKKREAFLKDDLLRPKTMAQLADPYQCYQKSVQDPKHEITNLRNIYLELNQMQPYSLREDFCGTAILCEAWVDKNVERSAIGVDIDPSVIEYGKKQFKCSFDRINLIVGDVMQVETEKVDILVALNYGVCYFHSWKLLVEYLKKSLNNLKPNGIFVCDVFGGTRAFFNSCKIREFGDFQYVFEKKNFDLLTNRIDCRLQFKFKDNSVLKDVFKYDFRIWSIAELREAFLEAGFTKIDIWIAENSDERADFVKLEGKFPILESFNACIVGSVK